MTTPGATLVSTDVPARDRGTPTAVPVVIAIDIEPDGRARVPGSRLQLDGLAPTVARFETLRPRLEDATGRAVRFAWYVRMDPQIEAMAGRADAVVDATRARLDDVRARGDRLGLHTHAGRWDVTRAGWVVDHGDPAWIKHCLRTGFAAYEAAFGEPCLEHRFGDRWSSAAAFDSVASLGAVVDLTLEPGQRAASRIDPTADATGRIPSYASTPRTPHRHRETPLWLLPLTSADPAGTLPRGAWLARRLRYVGQPRHRPLLLDRAWPSPSAYWSLVERTLEEQPLPYLAFAIRSDLSLRPRVAGVDAIFEELLRRPLVRRLAFTDGVGVIEALGLGSGATALAR